MEVAKFNHKLDCLLISTRDGFAVLSVSSNSRENGTHCDDFLRESCVKAICRPTNELVPRLLALEIPHDFGGLKIIDQLESSPLLLLVPSGILPGSSPRKITIWNFLTRSIVCSRSFRSTVVRSAWNRIFLVVSLASGELIIHDVRTMVSMMELNCAPNSPFELASFGETPTVQYLIYCPSISTSDADNCRAGLVSIIDCSQQILISNFVAHKSKVTSMCVSHRQKILITASETGTLIRLFRIPTGECIAAFRQSYGYSFLSTGYESKSAGGQRVFLCEDERYVGSIFNSVQFRLFDTAILGATENNFFSISESDVDQEFCSIEIIDESNVNNAVHAKRTWQNQESPPLANDGSMLERVADGTAKAFQKFNYWSNAFLSSEKTPKIGSFAQINRAMENDSASVVQSSLAASRRLDLDPIRPAKLDLPKDEPLIDKQIYHPCVAMQISSVFLTTALRYHRSHLGDSSDDDSVDCLNKKKDDFKSSSCCKSEIKGPAMANEHLHLDVIFSDALYRRLVTLALCLPCQPSFFLYLLVFTI